MMKAMLKYWKLLDVLSVLSVYTLGTVYRLSGQSLLIFSHVLLLCSKSFFYYKLYTSQNITNRTIFGITKPKVLKGILTTTTIGGLVILGFYYFDLLRINDFEHNINWIWTSIIISRIIESFIPYSHWDALILNQELYIRQFFGVKVITLKSEMTYRKITDEKIELQMDNLRYEVLINNEEINEFQKIINKSY